MGFKFPWWACRPQAHGHTKQKDSLQLAPECTTRSLSVCKTRRHNVIKTRCSSPQRLIHQEGDRPTYCAHHASRIRVGDIHRLITSTLCQMWFLFTGQSDGWSWAGRDRSDCVKAPHSLLIKYQYPALQMHRDRSWESAEEKRSCTSTSFKTWMNAASKIHWKKRTHSGLFFNAALISF